MTTFDWIAAERVLVADLLDGLSPEQVAKTSLCDGWRVQDVAGHMVVPFTVGTPAFGLAMLRARGNFAKANNTLALDAGRRPVADLSALLRSRAGSHFTPPGFGPEAPMSDILIHGQDIRRPLGLSRTFAPEQIAFVLDFLCTPKATRAFTKRGVADGLAFTATDIDWTHGSGAPVEGPAEALMLALAGRRVALDDLSGEGLATLRARF